MTWCDTTADEVAAPPGPAFCHAPYTSMHLDPSGNVRVCELNSMAMLGRIGPDRLRDLWAGARAGRIRAAMDRGDLSHGCEDCARVMRTGTRDSTHAAYYDRFVLTPGLPVPMPEWPVQLELSLSNACNLQCVMCNGDLSSAIRTHREGLPPLPVVYDDDFFDDLRAFVPHLERVTFIGGEPFLGRESLRVFDLLAESGRPITCGVTTNGTVLTPRVEQLLGLLPMEISVSIDGATPETYASIRQGGDLDAVLANVDRFADLATSLSLNYCLMVQNWHEFGAFLRLGDERGLSVHVNTVVAPRRFSLYHLSADELDAVLAAMRAEASATGGFGRNQPVWDHQLRRLGAHLASLRADPAPDAPPTASAVPVEVRQRSAADLAQASADDRGVHVLDVGRSEQIVAVHPDASDVLGMDLRPLIGGHLTALVAVMTDTFGELASSTLDYRPGGVEDRTMAFERDGATTHLHAVQGPGADEGAARWYLAARTTATGRP